MTNYRVEIVANQSVEDDIAELLEHNIPELEYTVIPTVHGQGLHTKKLGSSTWPEQNFLMFSYVDKEKAAAIKDIITKIQAKFPKEGISFFCVEEAKL